MRTGLATLSVSGLERQFASGDEAEHWVSSLSPAWAALNPRLSAFGVRYRVLRECCERSGDLCLDLRVSDDAGGCDGVAGYREG